MTEQQTVLTPREARQATSNRLNYRVLLRSMALVIAAFAIVGAGIYFFYPLS